MRKQLKILITVPEGEEQGFETYRKIAKELGIKSINMHIWDLVKQDEEKLFSIITVLQHEKKTAFNV